MLYFLRAEQVILVKSTLH